MIFKGVHYESTVKCEGFSWLIHSTQCAPVGSEIGIAFGPEDIHIMNKLVPFSTNRVEGVVTEENTVEFLGVTMVRPNLGLSVDTPVMLTIDPKDIEIVSEDISDLTVYLESMVWKGAYNEMVIWTHDRQMILHSQNDEQVATDIGIKFHTENILIEPLSQGKEA